MPRAKAAPAPKELLLPALWALGAAAFWLVPDQKLTRAKLLAVEAVVLLAGARLTWLRARGPLPGYRAALDVPVAVLAGSGMLFWSLSPDLSVSQAEAARLLFCGLAYWAANRSFAETGPAAFLKAWTLGAAAAGLWAVCAAAAGEPRPFASFGNPIFLGTALASAIPAAASLAALARGRERALWAAAAALQAAGLALTRSRSAVLGLLAGLGLWALARLDGRRRVLAIAAGSVLVAAGAWASREREWTHGLIWRDSLSVWRAHPFLGCGLGRFHLEFPGFASAALKARWPEGRVIVNFAHNEYLQTLVETGPFGLAALVSIPLVAWLMLLRDEAPEGRPARDAACAGALALFASAFVSPDLRFGASAFAAFALLGAAARPRPAGAAPPAIAPAFALIVLFALAAQPAIAVRQNAMETPFRDLGDSSERVRAAEDHLARAPKDADAAEQLGYLKAKASDYAGAAAAFRRAAELEPSRPGPLNNLGNLSYLASDFDGAISWWTKSLAAAPEQIDARLNLAKLLCERGRLKECSSHLDEVLRREPSNAKARVLYKKMVE